MKNILNFIGSAIYGIVVSYILWLLFYFLTPWLMSFGWSAVILYWLFAFGLLAGLIGGLSSILLIPLVYLISKCKIAKYLPIAAMLIFGYLTVALPWQLSGEYTFVKIVIAISLSSTALAVFVSLINILFSCDRIEINN